jgi:NO-binding membrane sensor protein with MHYT domain
LASAWATQFASDPVAAAFRVSVFVVWGWPVVVAGLGIGSTWGIVSLWSNAGLRTPENLVVLAAGVLALGGGVAGVIWVLRQF